MDRQSDRDAWALGFNDTKGTKIYVALSEAACKSLCTRLMATPTMDASEGQ